MNPEKQKSTLNILYKEIVKLKSEIKSVHIYCEEMERYTRDLENKIEIFRNTIKELNK